MIESMLTTTDNPFDPFTQYLDWDAWDRQAGYHTQSFLARLVVTSDNLSDADQELAVELAINEIVAHNITGNYVKVTRTVPDE